MRISIVIPTYEAKDHLQQSLQFIHAQEMKEGVELEVVVSDDGSTDGTLSVVQHFKTSIPNLIYTYRERDELSCRSRARNEGIKRSSGDVIVFLDSGMLIPPHFIQKVADLYTPMNDWIIAHYMYGVFTNPEQTDMSLIADIAPHNITQICEETLLHRSEWLDGRHGLFDLVEDDLERLPAPWTMGYSGALTAPRHLIDDIGGFDDAFQGWGAEDNDFVYRLRLVGGKLIASRDCFALHIPYVSASWEEKRSTNFENRTRLHRKKYELDTELYRYYSGTYYNRLIARFDHMVLTNMLSDLTEDVLDELHSIVSPVPTSCLIGIDLDVSARAIPTTHLFTHNRPTYARFKRSFPERTVHYILGCDTPYDDQAFDVMIITDFIRVIGEHLRMEVLKECRRIAKKLVFVCADKVSSSYDKDEEPWIETDDWTSVLEQQTWASTEQKQLDSFTIWIGEL